MENSILPYDIRQFCAGKVSLLDAYCLFQQDGIWRFVLKKFPYHTTDLDEIYVFVQLDEGGYAFWNDTISGIPDENIGAFVRELTENELYVFSNVGVGTPLELPVYEALQTHCSMILACTLMFAVVFKGALFPCLRRKKKGL